MLIALPTAYSLLTSHYSLLITHFSLLTSHHLPFPPSLSLFVPQSLSLFVPQSLSLFVPSSLSHFLSLFLFVRPTFSPTIQPLVVRRSSLFSPILIIIHHSFTLCPMLFTPCPHFPLINLPTYQLLTHNSPLTPLTTHSLSSFITLHSSLISHNSLTIILHPSSFILTPSPPLTVSQSHLSPLLPS